jgi:hypothetical protein
MSHGMKDVEFYIKYKTASRPIINSAFFKRIGWQVVLPTLGAVLVGPLIIYKYQRSLLFSFDRYVQLLEYCFLIVIPFILLFIWFNWRESVRQSRGYGWVGKFEVTKKRSSFLFCRLELLPGNSNLKVARSLFEKTRIGDFILIRRDALGAIEEIRRINHHAGRLTKTDVKSFLKAH